MKRIYSLLRWLAARWKLLLGIAAIVMALELTGAFAVMWSGVYNVGASRGHFAIVEALLRFTMVNSVKRHAPDAPPFPLDDPDRIRLGAAHFLGACATCHGIPGRVLNPLSQGMLPPPPDLKDHIDEWTDGELFWITKHGLKYTGMPAWPTQSRDEEVWTVVAFLRKLPALDTQSYLLLALGDRRLDPPGGRELATGTRTIDPTTACARCHGAENIGPSSNLVPRLHGQPVEMLTHALRAYAAGDRYSGIMQPIASDLPSAAIDEVARYYAALPPPGGRESTAHAETVEVGRRLALEGEGRAGVPACDQCHGSGALPLYPRLTGQNARYIVNQLQAWQSGEKGRTDTDAIMAPIARLLTDQQIGAAAAYYASLPAGAP